MAWVIYRISTQTRINPLALTREGRRGGWRETENDGKKEKILFMIAGKINPSLSCYTTSNVPTPPSPLMIVWFRATSPAVDSNTNMAQHTVR